MRGVYKSRQPIPSNIDGSHQVESQQCEVGQVVLSEPLPGEMGMQAAQAPKAPFAYTNAFQVWKHDTPGVAHYHVFDVALAVDQHANLTVNLVRQFGQLSRELLRYDLARCDSPLEKLLKALDLIGFQSLNVSFDCANKSFLHCDELSDSSFYTNQPFDSLTTAGKGELPTPPRVGNRPVRRLDWRVPSDTPKGSGERLQFRHFTLL